MKRRGRSVMIVMPHGGFKPHKVARANEPCCRDCVVWDKSCWCKVSARPAMPNAGMCEYGRRRRNSQMSMSCAKRKSRGG